MGCHTTSYVVMFAEANPSKGSASESSCPLTTFQKQSTIAFSPLFCSQ